MRKCIQKSFKFFLKFSPFKEKCGKRYAKFIETITSSEFCPHNSSIFGKNLKKTFIWPIFSFKPYKENGWKIDFWQLRITYLLSRGPLDESVMSYCSFLGRKTVTPLQTLFLLRNFYSYWIIFWNNFPEINVIFWRVGNYCNSMYSILELLVRALLYILHEKRGEPWNSCDSIRTQHHDRTLTTKPLQAICKKSAKCIHNMKTCETWNVCRGLFTLLLSLHETDFSCLAFTDIYLKG